MLSEENEESLQVDHAREIIQEQVSLLKRAYQRGGKWGSSEIEADLEKTWCYMEEVFDPADKIWGGLEHWGTWTSKAGAVKVAEGPGFWKVPRNWGFLEREKGVKHSCHGGGRGLSNGVHQHHNNGIGAGLEEEDE